jgi:hypothetical protein
MGKKRAESREERAGKVEFIGMGGAGQIRRGDLFRGTKEEQIRSNEKNVRRKT